MADQRSGRVHPVLMLLSSWIAMIRPVRTTAQRRASFVRGYARGYYGARRTLDPELSQLEVADLAAYRRGRLAGRLTRERVETCRSE
jgi:hypothetical protein